MHPVSDFRSDTVTRPSAAMRRAMAEAEVGDDVLDGDPTVSRLERAAALWLGKQGALFVPSGTMANQVALGAWLVPGDEIIAERSAHIVCFEAGALGFLHGAQSQTVDAPTGEISLAQFERAMRPVSIHCPRSRLLCVEQTFMGSGEGPGGCVVPPAHMDALCARAKALGLAVHMDGARLANAQVASGVPASRLAAGADSVSLCLSKGLGAPVGSVIAGDLEFLERGRRVRKRLGGWMRQAGVLAAAGLLALEQNVARLAGDHALAREVARVLAQVGGMDCDPAQIQTNIVFARVQETGRDALQWSKALERHGVRVMALGPMCLRLVTHLDVGPADVERLDQALRACRSS